MNEQTDTMQPPSSPAEPVIKQRDPISIVWLVPLIALIIGGWLAYKTVTEKGPVITIKFATADGLEAGKTKVKYKAVDVGTVQKIEIDRDLSNVILKVQMNKGAARYLTDQTKFWIVQARVSASEVSALDTLLSGAYIGIEPSDAGKPQRDFIGLETVPLVTNTSKGKSFFLLASRLGSLNPGSPIYFRQIRVGQVVDYKLDDTGDNVGMNIFIDSPYDQFVRENTKFWLASGIDMQLTANGLKVNTESVVSLLIGGVAFGTFFEDKPHPPAAENTTFTLYETQDKAKDEQYKVDKSYYVEFFESTRGLTIGAPVEFRGMQIGVVTDIQLRVKTGKMKFSTMVGITIERERLKVSKQILENYGDQIDQMIENGLRARLSVGNLLTGQLLVDVAYHPDAPKVQHEEYNDLLVIPSIKSSRQEVISGAINFVDRLGKLPLEDMVGSLNRSLTGIERLVNSPEAKQGITALQKILVNLETITERLDAETLPEVAGTLDDLHELTTEFKGWVSADSPFYQDLLQSLEQISKAARSVNNLADMLERHPEALIKGKPSEERK